MSSLLPSNESRTTAGGWPSAVGHLLRTTTIVVSAFLAAPSASTSAVAAENLSQLPRQVPQTNAGASVQNREKRRTSTEIGELRRLSGFTWDQLSRIFSVSRRAVHSWASGSSMSIAHEEQLHRVMGCVRQAYRGTAEQTRSAFLCAKDDGRIPFDLLIEGRYDEVLVLVSQDQGGPVTPVSHPKRTTDRLPSWRPEELVDALHDRVHVPGTLKPSTRGRTRRERLG